MHSATGGHRSQAENGEGSRNDRGKKARARKAHGDMQQFGLDGEVKEQRWRKWSAVRWEGAEGLQGEPEARRVKEREE